MDFIRGGASVEDRETVAQNMFRAWYVPFYNYGVIHGDPHFGNYTIRDDLSINMLDFGCVRFFQAKFVKGVIDLYEALQTGNDELAVSAYEAWGFHRHHPRADRRSTRVGRLHLPTPAWKTNPG